MSSEDIDAVSFVPNDSQGNLMLGGALSSEVYSDDLPDQTREMQSDAEKNPQVIESMEGVVEEIPDHGDNEQSVYTSESDNAKGITEDSLERNQDEEVNEMEEAMNEVTEETHMQDECDKSITEEQITEKYEEHTEESDILKSGSAQDLLEKETAVQSIYRPRVLAINQELAVGKEFADYNSFMSAVYQYCEEHGITYVTAFSKTVAARNKDCRKTFAEKLRFTHLRLRCKYGGAPRRSIACVRMQKLTCKVHCPSTLTVVAQRNPDRLHITTFIEDHNHELHPPISPTASRQKLGCSKNRFSASSSRSAKTAVDSFSNFRPSSNTATNLAGPRVPMAVLRPVSSLTIQSKLLSLFEKPINQASWRPVTLRGKNEKVVPVCRDEGATMLTRSPKLSVEHRYATPTSDSASNKKVVIDITGEADADETSVEVSKAVARVNEAWKCVYRVLEGDHAKLRDKMEMLRADNKRLRSTPCEDCGSMRR